jgi:hypothetical protein
MPGEHGEVPDHAAEAGPVPADGAGLFLELDVDQPDDRAADFGHELDARPVVVFLLAFDGVVVGRIEKREHPALEPASLVGLTVRPDDDRRHRAA